MALSLSTIFQAMWLQLMLLIPQMILLILLGFEVIKRRRREHLLWIGLMLAGQVISVLAQFLNLSLSASGQAAASPIYLVFTSIGYLVSTAGFVALLVVVYRSFKSQQISQAGNTPNDVWPPAPRSNF